MKKNIFGGIAVFAIAVAVAFNVNLNMNKTSKTSSLVLTNVEALADESGPTWERYCTYIPVPAAGKEVLSCYSCNAYFKDCESGYTTKCEFKL